MQLSWYVILKKKKIGTYAQIIIAKWRWFPLKEWAKNLYKGELNFRIHNIYLMNNYIYRRTFILHEYIKLYPFDSYAVLLIHWLIGLVKVFSPNKIDDPSLEVAGRLWIICNKSMETRIDSQIEHIHVQQRGGEFKMDKP